MIEKIHEYSKKIYPKLISNLLLRDTEIFPLVIPKLKLKMNDSEWMIFFKSSAKDLEAHSKKFRSFGYTVYYHSSGKSKITHEIQITFETLDDFLKFIEKENDFHLKLNNFHLLTSFYPEYKQKIAKNRMLLSLNISDLHSIIEYTNFLQENPIFFQKNREIPLAGSTKFLEKNKRNFRNLWKTLNFKFPVSFGGFSPLIRFKLSQVNQTSIYNKNIQDISVPLSDFIEIEFPEKFIFIVENKTTYLNFPIIKDSIVLHSEGYFYRKLFHAKFLKEKIIYYFGDLDIDGLNILSGVRKLFPQTLSILMNKTIFMKYAEFSIPDKKKSYNLPPNLTTDEKELYLYLNSIERNRLEQEKIPFGEMEDWIAKSIQVNYYPNF